MNITADDITSIEIEPILSKYDEMSFDITKWEIDFDHDDKIKIHVDGTYEIQSIYNDARGIVYGDLIINNKNKIKQIFKNDGLQPDYIELFVYRSAGKFNVDSSETFSTNLSALQEIEEDTFNGDYTVFEWLDFLKDETMRKQIIAKLKELFENKEFSLDTHELFDELKKLEIIDEYDCFNADYDNTLGIIMLPYFIRDFDDISIEDESAYIGGEPYGECDFGDIQDVRIYG